jgi:hypothetical protein
MQIIIDGSAVRVAGDSALQKGSTYCCPVVPFRTGACCGGGRDGFGGLVEKFVTRERKVCENWMLFDNLRVKGGERKMHYG